MYLLDSSAIIELLGGTERGRKIRDLIGEEMIVATAISLVEVLSGARGSMTMVASHFFKTVELLPFDREAASESLDIEQQLRKLGRPVERVDILIAGICKKHRIPIVTCDSGFTHMSMIDVRVIL